MALIRRHSSLSSVHSGKGLAGYLRMSFQEILSLTIPPPGVGFECPALRRGNYSFLSLIRWGCFKGFGADEAIFDICTRRQAEEGSGGG